MRAIDMPAAEQGRRMRALRRKVIENDVARWSQSFLDALDAARERNRFPALNKAAEERG
ncbi:Trehalose-phosphate synthase [compost metagenome]